MANIFLTNKCNLSCPYCFASDAINNDYEDITVENFNKALSFIKRDSSSFGLIGGEPSLHPKFGEILDIINNDLKIKHVILFTNGIEIDKYIDKLTNDKYIILINCNSPSDIGDKKFNKLKNNIKSLSKIKTKQINLGLNIYDNLEEYSFIFDLLKEIKSNFLRISYSVSNIAKQNTVNVIEQFQKIKPKIIKIYKECLNNRIVPCRDCNDLPYCIYNKEEKALLMKILELAKELNISNKHTICKTCQPVLDIFPDLTVGRCFGLAKYHTVPMNNFKTLEQIREYFSNTIDIYAKLAFVSPKCAECKYRLFDKCGICFVYKLKKAKTLETYIKFI